jgi:hypothetical protein
MPYGRNPTAFVTRLLTGEIGHLLALQQAVLKPEFMDGTKPEARAAHIKQLEIALVRQAKRVHRLGNHAYRLCAEIAPALKAGWQSLPIIPDEILNLVPNTNYTAHEFGAALAAVCGHRIQQDQSWNGVPDYFSRLKLVRAIAWEAAQAGRTRGNQTEAPKKRAGRPPAYPDSVTLAIQMRDARCDDWKEIHRKCKHAYPHERLPSPSSFATTVRREMDRQANQLSDTNDTIIV